MIIGWYFFKNSQLTKHTKIFKYELIKQVELKSIKEECINLSSREKNVAMRRARMSRKQKNRENNS